MKNGLFATGVGGKRAAKVGGNRQKNQRLLLINGEEGAASGSELLIQGQAL